MMTDISLLTIVRGRRTQLHNLLRGVAAQTRKPEEVIVVFMNEAIPDQLPDPGCKMYLHQIADPDHPLPLAAARNLAAANASGRLLAFLDVDCIPHPEYLELLSTAVRQTHGVVMGDVHYLPRAIAAEGWTAEDLAELAVRHPRRPVIPADRSLIPLAYHLFWSLSFGLRANDFARLGGFDEGYRGYGGEDTDFSFTARQTRIPMYACKARAFHQFHPTFSPPYHHLDDIIENADRFYKKWDVWPMEGWLKQFVADGYIAWESHTIRKLRPVEAKTLAAARSDSPFG
ncbi:GT2 family glycosyltransferase [Neolewinella xylanilytica]|uniref:GT2 family glycosyltransferase n=1 Tax=Neolewinella xylanilytica TaxID=1514080 RepID=A0A2S6IAB3_9BACT|nr:glycosyltransferase [Neolewinella xylanilytica]PPK88435.1 GT2 family glycosyltransferase [Neolewinella xylanilytica]